MLGLLDSATQLKDAAAARDRAPLWRDMVAAPCQLTERSVSWRLESIMK
jgi:hypothetical protein